MQDFKDIYETLSRINEGVARPDLVPEFLYHATFEPNAEKINKSGYLKCQVDKRNWYDSKPVICLATDIDTAISYCEASEAVDENEDLLDQIVVYRIRKSDLDLNELYFDTNVSVEGEPFETEQEEYLARTYEYRKDIPVSQLTKMVELKISPAHNYTLLTEVYPHKGEKKKDFIARFMSATKDEYPDVKQRFAVCMSYWNRRNKKKLKEEVEKPKTVVIKNRPFTFDEVEYYKNPEDSANNAIIEINGRRARLRAALLLINDDYILISREADDPSIFSIPGGSIEPGETACQAAARETKEEVELVAENVRDASVDYLSRYDNVKD